MRIAIILALLAFARPAAAHSMRTAYVELTEAQPGRARVRIHGKAPVTGIMLTAAAPCSVTAEDTGQWLACPGGLAGATLTVEGMGPIISEAVVLVAFADGTTTSACVTPRDPVWLVPGAAEAGALSVARHYIVLGIEHIATGADHLLFLLALVLCLRTLRAVMLAETAFTLSHTISFSASALGWVHVSAAAAEACIAASLVLVALDVGTPLRGERPWKAAGLAFAFGLVHGLGFAGGLAEIGLPASEVPAALAGFAGGVELGQIAFLAIALSVFALASRFARLERIAIAAGTYAVGGIGCFWLLERLAVLR